MKIARNYRNAAFSLVEIMIVIAIIGLLAAIAIPNFVKARTKSQTTICIKNLQMIDGAKETWALEMKRDLSDPIVEAEVNNYIKGGEPACPAAGTYAYNVLGTAPTCTVLGHALSPDGTVSASPPLGGGAGGPSGGDGSGSSGGSSGPGGGDTSGPGRN